MPAALEALAARAPRSWLPRRRNDAWGWRPPRPGARARAVEQRRRDAAAAVPGAAAACRLTQVLGAPLAGVLEAVADGVAESGRAEGSRRTALSGPRTTARLLACLTSPMPRAVPARTVPKVLPSILIIGIAALIVGAIFTSAGKSARPI